MLGRWKSLLLWFFFGLLLQGCSGPTKYDVLPLEAQDIERELSGVLPKLRFCFEKARSVQPDLNGKISFRFIIIFNGAVDEVKVLRNAMSVLDRDMEKCMMEVIQHVKFPNLRGEASEYPVTKTYFFQSNDKILE